MTETDPELAAVWNVALDALSRDPEVSPQQRAFVALTRPITVVDDMVILAAPNDFTRDILHTRLEPYVRKALGTALHRDVRLAITVDAAQAPGLDEDATDAFAQLHLCQAGIGPRPPGGPATLPIRQPLGRVREPANGQRTWTTSNRRTKKYRRRPPAEPEVCVRHLRHRQLESIRSCSSRRSRRATRTCLTRSSSMASQVSERPPVARHRALQPNPVLGRPRAVHKF